MGGTIATGALEMTITFCFRRRGLIGFPSNICADYGVEINGKFIGLRRINERSDVHPNSCEPHELHAPVAGPVWKNYWHLS